MIQELGETRTAMAKGLMRHLESVINDPKTRKLDKYYVLVHAKPFPNFPTMIKQKLIILSKKPSMMLSCMLFEVDNVEGKLLLHWCLPGDWPVFPSWSLGSDGEPVPEVVASYDRLDRNIKMKKGNQFFEDAEMRAVI